MRTKVLVLAVVGLLACGRVADLPGDSDPSADGGTTTGSGTSGGSTSTDPTPRDAGVIVKVDAGVKRSAGRCAKDKDCAPDGHCVELTAGGYRVCSYPPPAPQPCANGAPSPPDECCGTCAGGTCTLATSCGGAFIMPHNACAISRCATDADCGANGVCLPTGVGSPYARTCMPSNECLRHSDCTAAPDGVCALVGTIGPLPQCAPWACPGSSSTQVANGLMCIYGSECADDVDCAPGKGHCEKIGGRPTCQPGLRSSCPPPP